MTEQLGSPHAPPLGTTLGGTRDEPSPQAVPAEIARFEASAPGIVLDHLSDASRSQALTDTPMA